MIIFDTEDDSKECLADKTRSGFDKKVTQIAAISDCGKRFHNAGNVKEFFRWLHKFKSPQVWAFNAQYDIGNLCNSGDYNLDDFDAILVKGRFIRAQCEGINFFDARNLVGSGDLKTLGKNIGLEKLDGGDFRGKEYVFRDCEIPMKWLKFVRGQCDEFGIENLPATLGGLCTKIFTALGNENWFCDDATARSGLTGARVELFSQGGRGRIAYTDINSLYPACLCEPFPESFTDLKKSLDGYGLAEIEIKIPKMFLCPLPVKDAEGRLLFPFGNLRGVWTFHEIANAVKVGGKIKKVFWSKGSKSGARYYAPYIHEIYDRRLKAENLSENLFFKLLLNNLYGRLAISGEISRTLNLTEENRETGLPFGRKILCDVQMPLNAFTNYLHAAYVLSYARLKLFKYLSLIPPADLIYCDTDSAMFFCKGELPFPVSKNLGEMKLEKFGKKCVPHFPKVYQFDNEFKAKGVPRRLAEKFIKTGKANFEQPFKIREAMTFYDADDASERSANTRKLSVWRRVSKERKTEYTKKKLKNGFFLPIRLNM